MPNLTRRTSAYFLRIFCTPRQADAVLDLLVAAVEEERAVIDQYRTKTYVSVGFRAANDTAALDAVASLRRSLPDHPDWSLLTGYGMHHRLVAQSAQ